VKFDDLAINGSPGVSLAEIRCKKWLETAKAQDVPGSVTSYWQDLQVQRKAPSLLM